MGYFFFFNNHEKHVKNAVYTGCISEKTLIEKPYKQRKLYMVDFFSPTK